jgi:rhamnulokinase
MGNVLMQMMALGQVGSLAEGRQVVRRSSELETFEPADRSGWDEAFGRLLALMGTG